MIILCFFHNWGSFLYKTLTLKYKGNPTPTYLHLKTPTRVALNGKASLIDHIYVNNPHYLKETSVPSIAISDHFPICATYKKCSPHDGNAGHHNVISYRNIKAVNDQAFQQEIANK